ncbi:MAG TPA: hypothetical protein PKZ76_15650 [Xanthomonadaceae bacterium]|nr:hypothetical protein [Xanthomonadaceae bacterium]
MPDDAEVQAFQATRITLTFTNHGPDDAPTVATGTSFSQGFMGDSYVLFAVPETPPCIINYTDLLPPPPAPIFWSATVLPQPASLPAGESVICIVGLYVHPLLAGTQVEVPFNSIAGLDDPNPDNNNPVVTLDVYRPLADLEAIIEVDRNVVEAGETVRATLTLTNHGPEAVVATGIETNYILGDDALETIDVRPPIDIPPDAEIPPCFPLVDGDLSLWPPAIRWTGTVYMQPASLGVGETRACVFDILVLPALDGRVHDVHFAIAAHIDDPDPTNSSPVVRLRVGQPALPVPQPVPTASGLALALVVLGVLAIGLFALRRSG